MTTADVLLLEQVVVKFRWWLQSGRGAVARHFPLGMPIHQGVGQRLDHLIYSGVVTSNPRAADGRTGIVTIPPMPLKQCNQIVDYLLYGDEVRFEALSGTAVSLLAPVGRRSVRDAWSDGLQAGRWDVILIHRLRHDPHAREGLARGLVPPKRLGSTIDMTNLVTMVGQVRATLRAGGLENDHVNNIIALVVTNAGPAIAAHLDSGPEQWDPGLVTILNEQDDLTLSGIARVLQFRLELLPEGLGFDSPDQRVDEAKTLRDGLERHFGLGRGRMMFDIAIENVARRWGGHLFWSFFAKLDPNIVNFPLDPKVVSFLTELSGSPLDHAARGYGFAAATRVGSALGGRGKTRWANEQFAHTHRFGDPMRGLQIFAEGLRAPELLQLADRAGFLAQAWMTLEDVLREKYERHGRFTLPDPATHAFFESLKEHYAQLSAASAPTVTGKDIE